ncbi:unnamed protein product [Oppiella nova]|uniref:AB hydrolase-1 domain-containing protein n=1 Tax=Oppiella nova TaxID=334625 RepID=A0A7R9LE74_9ACAR|nr:unnamed protein product [Oppiella nova]CAG2162657.1 unnamed protein product [Oppiella nova]
MARIMCALIATKNRLLRNTSHDLRTIHKRFVHMLGQKVSVCGHNIHYERVGTGKRTVLLLPGALGSTRTDFTPQLEGMDGERFTLIAWDPPGYGYSRPPERVFSNFHREDAKIAAQLMSTLGEHRYSVVGWSGGGTTALIIAAANLLNVQKVVVFGANAYVTAEDKRLMREIQDLNKWHPKARQAYADLYGADTFAKLWHSFVEYYCKLEDTCRADLKAIKQPTLILHGDLDPMVPMEHPMYLLDSISHSTLHRFPKGKHNIHQQYSEEFNKIVEKFLIQ